MDDVGRDLVGDDDVPPSLECSWVWEVDDVDDDVPPSFDDMQAAHLRQVTPLRSVIFLSAFKVASAACQMMMLWMKDCCCPQASSCLRQRRAQASTFVAEWSSKGTTHADRLGRLMMWKLMMCS